MDLAKQIANSNKTAEEFELEFYYYFEKHLGVKIQEGDF